MLEIKHLACNENYMVSKSGKVYSKKRIGVKGGELKQFVVDGYYRVSLWVNGKYFQKSVHRLVAETFIDNAENKPCVNHKDGNKLIRSLESLAANGFVNDIDYLPYGVVNKLAEWHFDVFGLIEKGLAIDKQL